MQIESKISLFEPEKSDKSAFELLLNSIIALLYPWAIVILSPDVSNIGQNSRVKQKNGLIFGYFGKIDFEL